jgi:putative ABC transport system permease protein
VADVQTIEMMVRVELEAKSDPIIGQLIGVDRQHPPRLNRVTVRAGHGLDEAAAFGGRQGDGAIPALVSEAFAQAHHLGPGTRLTALINGKRRTLVVAGHALSPEYIFAGRERREPCVLLDSVQLGGLHTAGDHRGQA